MARKLTIWLSVEQMRQLHERAKHEVESATGDDRVRWLAIVRESGRALTFDAERTGGSRGSSDT